jgi:DNA-binding FadR family transcriptional regulator
MLCERQTSNRQGIEMPLPVGMISPVKVQSATALVVERLEALILDGSLSRGERIPAEPDLATAFEVGRSTIREAKKTLIAQGLLESRGKLGTFVAAPSQDFSNLPALRDLLADPALVDLHECRQIVEVAAIRMSATRITAKEIDELYAILDRIEAGLENESDSWFRLVNFHRNLVSTSGNKVLLSLFDLLAHLLRKYQLPFYGSIADLQAEVRSHRDLVDLVARHDPDVAANAIREHLDNSEQLRQSALENENRK